MPASTGPGPAFVLVHGGFAGSWCWDRVAPRLREQGHQVFTPTLPGLAERADELTRELDLTTHADTVVHVADKAGLEDFVLCGHSYGGMVITLVAERLATRIRSLIYLDAVLPAPGTSLWENMTEAHRRTFERATDGLLVHSAGPGPGMVNAADREWVAELSCPHPLATFHERVPMTTNRDAIPTKIHLRARGYPSPMLDASHERARGWGWTCLEMSCAHIVTLDDPDAVCELLLGAAR